MSARIACRGCATPCSDCNKAKKRARAQGQPVVVAAAPSVRDRPQDMDSMIGQETLVTQLRTVCAGAKLRGTPVPHVLIAGPAGHGKTTLAGVIANEVGGELVTTTAMTLRQPKDLIGILVKAKPNTVLFIDEIHALPRLVVETLYEVLEDGKLTMMAGSGAEAVPYTHQLEGFVCVGATTRPGLLTTPFRQRFGFSGTVEPYSVKDLAKIVHAAWRRVGVTPDPGEATAVAKRCKGVPRRALHLAERVLDYCIVMQTEVERGRSAEALRLFGIDDSGLDETDIRILETLTQQFAGRTVGLDALAQALDMDAKTLQEQYEPYLTQAGLISRTKSGRMAMPAAYEMLRERAA